MPCGLLSSLSFSRSLFLLQFIPQLILNRAGAEFVESIRGVIFYRGSSITYIKLYMLLCLYMACLCVCTIAHTPRGAAMHSDNKTDKTDMLAGKYQFQYQLQLRIQLQLQFQFRFLFRLWPSPSPLSLIFVAAKKVRELLLPLPLPLPRPGQKVRPRKLRFILTLE